ncbi:MAG: SDR family oxidoreductase [Steroidobacteraceae bacterium]|nr:SDR family oxidoreductase [Steroidobacteraceae bacterium]MDW8258661.1 SDR family oxidoreductase [Gammaproteobacteria bacterium]
MPTVLVTGANRGLGLEFARQYAADGWTVHACVRAPQQADALQALKRDAEQAGQGRIEIHALDVRDHAAIDQLAATLDGVAIDVLINCAGTMGKGSFAEQGIAFGKLGRSDFADWENTFRVNVIGPMKMAEAFVPHVALSEQKKIVSLTSELGSIGGNKIGSLYAYRATKAGLNAIMKSMAIDLGRQYRIIAIPLHPGWVRTDMGGPRAPLDAATSVRGMRKVIAELDAGKSGRFWAYDGSELPW